ncbi:PhoH family protein, partial [[Clostridium] innocuum]|nr:PhoH family protein [[Clostridium] innocuum]
MSEQFRIALEEYPMEWIVKLCGAQDKHLELLRNAFSCDIIMRDNELRILSEDAVTFHSIESVVKALFNMMEAHIDVSGRDIEYACRLAKLNRLQELSTTYQKAIGKTVNGKLIYPKTIGQRHLFKCMCNSEIVFATGVAGTGKTYLAVVY